MVPESPPPSVPGCPESVGGVLPSLLVLPESSPPSGSSVPESVPEDPPSAVDPFEELPQAVAARAPSNTTMTLAPQSALTPQSVRGAGPVRYSRWPVREYLVLEGPG